MMTVPVILGPTAGGKSELALRLAEGMGADILSVDSMKIYRGMNIGTAKPDAATLTRARHHLIDIRNPDESYSSYDFYTDCCALLQQAKDESRVMILEGGTALYFNSLFAGYCKGPDADWEFRRSLEEEAEASDDESYLHTKLAAVDAVMAERLHPNDMRRIIRALEVYHSTGTAMSSLQAETTKPAPFDFTVIGLRWPREVLYQRINDRVDSMLADGLLDEVRELTEQYEMSRQALQGLGYKELLQHILGEIDYERARELIQQKTRNFAKHQLTWFRGWDQIQWLDAEHKDIDTLVAQAQEILST